MPAERPAPPAAVEPADPQQVLRDARAKFVAAFSAQIAYLADLVTRAAGRDAVAAADLQRVVHRLAGFEVLTDLRRLEHRPRVVVLSAREHDEDVARAFDLGADDYLAKPFSPQELRARISRLLR